MFQFKFAKPYARWAAHWVEVRGRGIEVFTRQGDRHKCLGNEFPCLGRFNPVNIKLSVDTHFG